MIPFQCLNILLNYHYFSFTDDEKSAERSLVNDIDHLHDPEKMLDISTNNGKEVATKLITEITFIKGLCGNKFSKDSKPRLYYFTEDSFAKHDGIPSMEAVLDLCLGQRQEEDVVIMCNTIMEVNLVQSALKIMKKTSVQYVPYLRNTFPTTEQKQDLLEKLNSDNELILLTDYRSFRGCEASHSIILTDLDKPIGSNIMAEMLSRTMADLDFIALPKKNTDMDKCTYVNPIETAFDTWKKRGLVQTTTVKFHDEDESSITFKLHDSCEKNPCKEIPCKENPCKENPREEIPTEIEKPSSGFIFLQSNDNLESPKSYL